MFSYIAGGSATPMQGSVIFEYTQQLPSYEDWLKNARIDNGTIID